MKVLLVNGSPHKYGCTDAALDVLQARWKQPASAPIGFGSVISRCQAVSAADTVQSMANVSTTIASTLFLRLRAILTVLSSGRRYISHRWQHR